MDGNDHLLLLLLLITLLTLSDSIRTTLPPRWPTTVDSMVHLLQEYYHILPRPVKPGPGKTTEATLKVAPYKSLRLAEMKAGFFHPMDTPSPGRHCQPLSILPNRMLFCQPPKGEKFKFSHVYETRPWRPRKSFSRAPRFSRPACGRPRIPGRR